MPSSASARISSAVLVGLEIQPMGGTDHAFAVQIEIGRDALESAGAVEDRVGEPRRIGRRGHQRNRALGPLPLK